MIARWVVWPVLHAWLCPPGAPAWLQARIRTHFLDITRTDLGFWTLLLTKTVPVVSMVFTVLMSWPHRHSGVILLLSGCVIVPLFAWEGRIWMRAGRRVYDQSMARARVTMTAHEMMAYVECTRT